MPLSFLVLIMWKWPYVTIGFLVSAQEDAISSCPDATLYSIVSQVAYGCLPMNHYLAHPDYHIAVVSSGNILLIKDKLFFTETMWRRYIQYLSSGSSIMV